MPAKTYDIDMIRDILQRYAVIDAMSIKSDEMLEEIIYAFFYAMTHHANHDAAPMPPAAALRLRLPPPCVALF